MKQMTHDERVEHEKYLANKFPLFFTDMHGNSRQTCMAWGLSIGQGWLHIIEELAEKIEPILRKIEQKQLNDLDSYCYQCGQMLKEHPVDKKFKSKFDNNLTHIECEQFIPVIPKASQIKEKFGTLHIYLSCYTDKIDKLVKKAEEKSSKTCERCGDPGKLRGKSWYVTMCKKCYDEYKKRKS